MKHWLVIGPVFFPKQEQHGFVLDGETEEDVLKELVAMDLVTTTQSAQEAFDIEEIA